MDKEAYMTWLEQIDTDTLLSLANAYGHECAAIRYHSPFEEFLIDYYSRTVVPEIESKIYEEMKQ